MKFPFEIIEKPATQILGFPASIRVRLENDNTLVITVVDVESKQTYTYIRKGDVVTSAANEDAADESDFDSTLPQPICALKVPDGALRHIFTARFAMYINRYAGKSFADLQTGPTKRAIDSSNLDVDLSF